MLIRLKVLIPIGQQMSLSPHDEVRSETSSSSREELVAWISPFIKVIVVVTAYAADKGNLNWVNTFLAGGVSGRSGNPTWTSGGPCFRSVCPFQLLAPGYELSTLRARPRRQGDE
jgi:hypothetical protein